MNISTSFFFHTSSTIITSTVTPRIPVRPDWRIRTGFRDSRPCTGTHYLIFFFLKANWHLWVWPTSYNKVKRTTTGVVSIKIYTHILSPFFKYKTVLLQLQIRATNLHVVNPYKCVGPAVCGCLMMSSPVHTRIKNPC